MGDNMKKDIEKFEADYDKIFAKGTWEPKDITMMKDLQKLMYYIEVRCAMKEGEEYPGSEYMDRGSYMNHSYANNGQMRNASTGRYMSRDMGHGYYDDGRGMSGHHYYNDEKDNAINELHRFMESKNDPMTKSIIQDAIRKLEMK